uniref:COBRA-like protein n=1 Tax=Solanum tuberosum TaxID=4113 RepID=M1CAH0_SOLTU
MCFTSTDAYDSLDPNGNITVKWDIKSWTPDGYIAIVTIYNFQKYRHIQAPGWQLGWTWAKKEIIWSAAGGQATEQGDCSKFKGSIPHCCKRDPFIVDLLPGTPYNQQVSNCCRGGVISSWVQDPEKAVSAFQITVGQAGTSNKTVRLPKNFTLKAPGHGYTCGPAMKGKPTKFLTPDGRRFTQALILSSEDTDLLCLTVLFLQQHNYKLSDLHMPDSPYLASTLLSSGKDDDSPVVRCTKHMCPIRVHWHIKTNYKAYWRVKITITNFNYKMNYSQWNLVVQHPSFENLTQIFSFNYEPLLPYGSINDTAMFWGIQYYNDQLMQGGPSGNVQSEIILQKDKLKFTFEKGWAFPRKVYFNGDNCVMPPPDAYPYLPNASAYSRLTLLHSLVAILVSLVLLYSHNL